MYTNGPSGRTILHSADVPDFIPLTGTETTQPTSDHRFGSSALRVELPPARGAQGVYAHQPVPHGAIIRISLWIKARAGKRYQLVVTRQDGAVRRVTPPFRATGVWQLRTVNAALFASDAAVNVVVRRTPRSGTELFELDALSIVRA
jgi:hypothetical protein